MNSVISAFTKTKKNQSNNSNNIGSSGSIATVDNNSSSSVSSNNIKQNGGANTGCTNSVVSITKKKGGVSALNAQDNGYQYLRHIREIETANKLLSPVVVDADDLLESELLNFRPPLPPNTSTVATSVGSDVVDHCIVPPATVRLLNATAATTTSTKDDDETINADFNMNGSCLKMPNNVAEQQQHQQQMCLENGNVDIFCNDNIVDGEGPANGGLSSPTLDVDDDEISEHSTAACTSTSSSEHSNSTVVHSPTVATNTATTQQRQPSPAKSLSSTSASTHYAPSNISSSSSSSSCSTSSVAITCGPRSTQSSTTTLSSLCSSNGGDASGEQLTITTMSNGMATLPPSPSPSAHSPTTIVNNCQQTELNDGIEDYVPAFLKTTPITLPIKMPNTANGRNIAQTTSASASATPVINSAATTPKHARFTKPRLTLSRFINHSMPSVHGRPNLSVPPNGGGVGGASGTAGAGNAANANGTNPPKRISTHQRNLSLDFRSMGIFLPPVSQVTNTRINHTQHHRNRSLDSALQRIPEVEVSSPNAESENTFCSPSSILGTNMCSKIVTTAANMTAALSTTTTPALTSGASTGAAAAASVASPSTLTSYVELVPPTPAAPVHHHYPHPLHTLQHGPSVVVESCPTLRARPKSSGSGTRVQDMPGIIGTSNNSSSSATSSNSSGSSKKREDLTSLGSDDSGIICGSESDQISLNRIRHSHESLDSGEMDAEEECIDMLETNSMDEEYNLLHSDLCFYPSEPSETDCRTLRPSRKQKQQQQIQQQQQQQLQHQQQDHENSSDGNSQGGSLDDRLRYRVMNMSLAAINMERGAAPNEIEPIMDDDDDGVGRNVGVAAEESADVVDAAPTPTNTTPTTITTASAVTTPTLTESTKNDQVLFKNFFGATKNAIFRTAQSIIENHEKKNAAKQKNEQQQECVEKTNSNAGNSTISPQDQVKSPTDISKKKEFFSLLTSNSSKKAAAAAAAAAASAHASAANTPAATPTVEANGDQFKSPNFDEPAVTKRTESNERTLNLRLPGAAKDEIEIAGEAINTHACLAKSASINSLNKLKVPGVVKYFISDRTILNDSQLQKTEKGPSGLLRFFESPVFNIHFAVHYLFYSKEPGVLSFIGNKIFSFPDQEVDLYIPQLIVMYIQMDELAEVLDPYLTIRCRKSVDFSLKCLWLLEAYNYQVDSLGNSARKSKLALMKEIFSKKESKILSKNDSKDGGNMTATALIKKTHHRSQSDATVLLTNSNSAHTSISNRLYQQPPYTTQTLPPTPAKLCLGDLTSGRAFDNGCTCFESVRGQVNGLLGQKTFCSCGAPKTAPQKEFMKALINVGKNLTSLPSKAEKTSALRMFLNLINKNLPARVWLPLYSDIPHHVVRITEEKTAVLNSKDKTPYIIYVEVLEVPDIYSLPVIPKMMPTLRHTKSEEHLEGACGQLNHASCSRTSSCSSHNNGSSCRRKKEKLISESSSIVSIDAHAGGQTNGGSGGACGDGGHCLCNVNVLTLGGLHLNEDDVWSQEDDEITAQYMNMRKISERDAISQMSLDSCDSREQGPPVVFNIGDVRTRHCNNLNCENTKSFSNDPEDPSAAALKEPWHEKEQQIRESSPYGHLSNWRLLSAIVKCGDDLRQELMATQLLQMFKIIWQEEHVDLWVRPYKIICLSNDSGLIEPILNTVSLHQIKKNSNKSLRDYFIDEYGPANGESFRRAQKNFVQSCAAYCLISYLLQVKDRHNGNILLHSDGHIIHIDFGFILSISPKNLGFEQSPFKLTPEFVDVMGGTSSEHWREFNRLLLIGMMSARKHMDRIINFVEIMRSNAQLPCFKNGCSGTVQNLRKRFHMNLTEQEMERKVEQLVQDSLKSLSTKLYDGYQYYTNGIL